MNIAVAANKTFVKYLYVMLTSLLENNCKGGLCSIYLLSSDLEEEHLQAIKELVEKYHASFYFIRVSREKFPKDLPSNEWITVETYFRLALPDLLPAKMERILYLDADIIINQPLKEFYETDFEGKSFLACRDQTPAVAKHLTESELFLGLKKEQSFQYFNAGVLLFNLEKLRKEWSFEGFIKTALELKDHLAFHDQDLLNYIFWNDVKYAEPERYNLIARIAFNAGYDYPWAKKHTAVLHYAGPKPWRHKEVRYELERFWWEYAKKTPFYTELLEDMVMPEIDTGYMDQLFRQLKQENDELRAVVDKCMHLLKSNLHLT